MIGEQHIVEKLKVDVDVDSIELAEKIKSEINDFIQNEVLSIVESYFSTLDLPQELKGKVIQLDKVDLSIEPSSWNTNSANMKQEIRREVEKQMNPIIDDLKEKNLKSELSLAKSYSDIEEQDVVVYSKEERVLKSMFHFLDHGTLPWWINSVEESRELFSENFLIATLREQTAFAGREFQKRRDNPGFRKRLVQQFPVSVVSEMIQISLSSDFTHRKEVSQELKVELENLKRANSSEIVGLLVELSNPRIIDEVFRKDSSVTLFKQIHSELFNTDLIEASLESTLKTTFSVLRVLYAFAGRESEFFQMTPEFQKSLEGKLPSDVLTPLKETKAYQKVFVNENPYEVDGTLSDSIEKDPLSKEQFGNDPLESGLIDKKANGDPTSVSEKEQLKIKNEQESVEGEMSKGELEDSALQMPNERIDQEETKTSTEKSEVPEVESRSDELEGRIDQSIKVEDAPSKAEERKSTDDTSDQKYNEESIDRELSLGAQQENDLSERTSNSDDRVVEEGEADDKEALELDQSDSVESSKSKDSNSRVEKDQEVEIESEGQDNLTVKSELNSQSKRDKNNNMVDELGEILKKRSEELKKKDMESMPNQLFVENAGLVLLNPFLPALFKELELVGEDGKLTNPDLAACILHYAATGREGDYEFEMAFEKYLCGIPPSISLDREVELSEKQKEEVGKVLNSVLEHWSALKSKSIELLQNEFLTRSGKLIVEKSNHRLVIEKKTFDLLLDKLPWSYSLIKFSWKKELIFVEW